MFSQNLNGAIMIPPLFRKREEFHQMTLSMFVVI